MNWRKSALCAQVGGDFWYAEKGDHAAVAHAKKICRQCPVIQECLSHALQQNEEHGVWGGMTKRERQAARRATRGRYGRHELAS